MLLVRTLALFFATAIAEILGCYLVYLVFRKNKSSWLWIPSLMVLSVFAWLLTKHPMLAGRTYAAYGGVYVVTALAWLGVIERHSPDTGDLIGASFCLLGMLIIVFFPRA